MNHASDNHGPVYSYRVWDRSVRLFHWLNVICVIGLIGVGLVIMNNKSFGVSADGKILLKTIHVYFGYVFAANLTWRIAWGFIGGRFCRWPAIFPFGKGYLNSLISYLKALKTGRPVHYAGHNPVARMMATLLFLLLIAQASTGLILAGTDLYFPPFGQEMAEWVAGEDRGLAAELKPGSKEGVDPVAYQEMRAFRKPFITIHNYAFYVLSAAILLHIIGVVVTEIKEKSGLVSAMFTGNKFFHQKPLDWDDDEA
ncbi:cytochrome b/b6 domain-containing protein [Methylomarinum vadi]|uniref:cytochrome b/b6 domain-containing protein n=1 Tax=Methylomarinum vadi TaxID=438855 RepID=UPI0004DEEE15|nr:cytochrome b/b6 domain-containing protein [Methylomarinum vadi]